VIGIDEWAKHWWLVTPEGTLDFNVTDTDTQRRFQLAPLKCTANLPVRVTQDDVPQGDGAIPHRRWRSGFTVHVAVELLIDEGGGQMTAACDEDLLAMIDLLGLHINAMIRTGLVSGFPNARLLWTPSGEVACADVGPTDRCGDRMFDRIQLNTGGAVSEGDIGTLVEFDVDTPYPYYIEAQETDTFLGASGVETITNDGNTQYYPVIRVDGPTSNFVLLNDSVQDLDGNPLELRYDDTLPPGTGLAIPSGHYLEINFFTGQAFLDGSGANRKAGIDMRYSDFWPIVPGDNLIASLGANATVLSNGAWA
jgi:hypothetical protein